MESSVSSPQQADQGAVWNYLGLSLVRKIQVIAASHQEKKKPDSD